MNDYVVPQVLVFQEFRAAAEAVQLPLQAFVFGPQYGLVRYTDAEERLLGALGAYIRSANTAYVWPNRPTNSTIDQDYTRVFFESAWLRYASFTEPTYTINAVTGHPNRIRAAAINFATFDDGTTVFPRHSSLINRDVRAGDGIRLTGTAPVIGAFDIKTKINALINEVVPSTIATPAPEGTNDGVESVGATVTLITGTTGDLTFSGDATAYEASADGDITDTYTIEVVEPGAFGIATLRVISASGNDDVLDEFATVASGAPIAIGTRGLTVTFTTGTGAFSAGDVWSVDVAQNWTPAVLSEGGTYTGSKDGTYIVEVTKGGFWATEPQVFVTSTGTLESSGPFTVDEAVAFILPTGVELTFAAAVDGLSKGDRYFVDVEAVGQGAIQTLELTNSLPDELYTDPTDINIELSIIKDLEIPRLRTSLLENWTTTDAEITVNSLIPGTDASWFLNDGSLPELPITQAEQFVHYRALMLANTVTVKSITDISEVTDALGPVVPDNPLAFAAHYAKLNSGGVDVKYMATAGDENDLAAFSDVLEAITGREDVYGLVPLTHNKMIQDAVLAHCVDASSEVNGRWRVCWFAAQVNEETAVLILDANDDILEATILDNPDTTSVPDDYTRMRSNLAQFITNGVQGGDIVRTLYTIDAVTGEEAFEEFVVDAVLTEEELRLVAGPDSEITVASRFEIYHPNSKDEMATDIAGQAGAFTNRRARMVFPDEIGNGGLTFDGMFVAAALSGLRSGVNPHQGLTNVELIGFDDVTRTTQFFRKPQLDIMAAGGVWIVTQDTDTGTVFSRHQLTTDMSDLRFREDSIVSNFDSISYFFLRFFRDNAYIGRRNITPALIVQLKADFRARIDFLRLQTNVPRLGPQLVDGRILSIEVHDTLKDRVVVRIEVDLPAPLNHLEIHLIA